MVSLMQKLCLKPQYPLRRQLLVSFGSSAFLTLAFVVALASITVHFAGHAVKERSNEVMRDQVVRNIVTSTRNLADQFTAYLLTLDGTVQLMVEFARDRIVGYGEEGWDDDRYVPFFDIESQTNKYPLRSPPLPLDWQINPNIVSENAWEHLQERTPLNPEGRLTSQSSSFAMQGTCDPNITDSNHFNYYPNCTDENNNILTGGKVQPVSTAKAIYDKAGDLNVFLKPLFESQRDAYFLGIYFHNAGAGATLTYPGVSRGGYLETYESGGCDWMRNTNPYTKRPFGTDEEIGRCHMQGTVVSEREFNPMEEIWCQEMALHPEKVVKYGPYTRANSGNFRLMSAGTGIFDRKNGNFIGCAAMKVPVDFLAMSLSDSLLVEDSIIAVVRFDNGHLVADSNSSYALFENDGSHHISETGMISTEQFETFRSIILSIPQYTETTVRDAMAKTVLPCEKGGLISAYPLPTPPIEYDPQYKPDFLMIQVIGDEIFLSISKNAEAINADVRATVLVSAMLGFTAVMIVLAIVWCVSRVLTRPLSWIEGIAWQIVNHSDCRTSNKLLVGKSYDLTPIVQCAPTSEITDDVDQDLRSKATLYFALVAAATFGFTVFAFFMVLSSVKTTVMVTEPVILLLQVIQDINNREVQEDVPPLRGGSKETRQVYNSFAKLYKIIQISNTAFFSGNLSWACHFLNDAIRLFRKVDDKKAIGVACNNLANVCYAQIHAHHNCDVGLNTSEDFGVVRAGLEHYDEAIAISEIEFEQATCLVTKAGFAYELADRLFNRGMFLLALQGDPDCPDDGRVRALADVSRARDLDIDTREFLLAHKLLLDHSEPVFGRIIRRIHGLISFHRDEELGELWALQELIEDADQLLLAAWNEPVAPLFQSVSRTGRLQQLEAAAIRLELSRDNDWEAARLAMRMFAEDEYLMEGSFQVAANALLRYSRATDGAMPFTRTTFQSTRSDFRKMLKTCKNGSVDIGKCLIFALEINKRWEDDPIMDRINANCLRLYDECCNPEDSMGLVASTTRGSYSLNLSTKSENEGLQRSTLDIATSGTSGMGSPSLPFAVQMVVDSSASQENDSYVLLVADGCSLDSASSLSIKRQIERLKRERQTTIHFIILGLDAEHEAELRECQIMCTGLSKASFYMNVTLANVDAAFCRIAHVVSHPPVTNSSLQGLTTEKF